MLARTADLVADAQRRHTAVAAFNMITFEQGEAIVAAAERADSALIIQLSENAVRFHGGRLRPFAAAAGALAEDAGIPIAVHLDHVTDTDLLPAAIGTTISSVMIDAAGLPYRDNLDRTRAATAWAHERDLWVEAELGYVGGKPDAPRSAHAPGTRTDPEEAAAYVAATGIDALAVAVGSSHAMTTRTATLDHELIRRIAVRTPVPLVLHGSSGVPDDELRAAVHAGMRKINIGTALNVATTATVRSVLDGNACLVDPRGYLAPAREATTDAVTRALAVIGAAEQPR